MLLYEIYMYKIIYNTYFRNIYLYVIYIIYRVIYIYNIYIYIYNKNNRVQNTEVYTDFNRFTQLPRCS